MRHWITTFSLFTVVAAAFVLISAPGLLAKRKTVNIEKKDSPAIIRIQTIPGGCSIVVSGVAVHQKTEEGKWLEMQCTEGAQSICVSNDSAVLSFHLTANLSKPVMTVANLRTGKVYTGISREKVDTVPCSFLSYDSPDMIGKLDDAIAFADSVLRLLPRPQSLDTPFLAPQFNAVEIPPEMIKLVNPGYPLMAKQGGIEGTVWVMALVNKDGVVLNARVAKTSSYPSLDSAAARSAWLCRYKPMVQQGRPVACWVVYPVKFNLNTR